MNGYELLVHNLSHSDMILTVKNDALDGKDTLARPKFSKFKDISEDIYNSIRNKHPKIHSMQPFSRQEHDFIRDSEVGIGFDLTEDPVHVQDHLALRYRQDEILSGSSSTISTSIVRVCFPLIAVLIPKWIKQIGEEKSNSMTKVIILVSGRGTPTVDNANMLDNSTKFTAMLIQLFINTVFPKIRVELIDSATNLFRYDQNIVFVKQELAPMIDSYRDELVKVWEGKWKENMKVTLSFADGSSARISAISASLRHYRPSYMHFWQLKSFWREQKICEEDIEYHSFEEICTEPAVSLEGGVHDPNVQLVVNEMAKFREYFNTALAENPKNDLDSFWLRKSKKPVLAVLLVQKPGQEPKLYRGTNMEVSMPTGSLCAERNVIGSALADDITLKRQDLKIIAVYSGNMNPTTSSNTATSSSAPIDSPGRPMETIAPLCIDSEAINAEYFKPVGSPPTNSRNASDGSVPRSPQMSGKRKIMNISNGSSGTTNGTVLGLPSQSASRVKREDSSSTFENISVESPRVPTTPTGDTSPILRESPRLTRSTNSFIAPTALPGRNTVPNGKQNGKKEKRIAFKTTQSTDVLSSMPTYCSPATTTHIKGSDIEVSTSSYVISVDENDMNPLKPCGACNEWLKKIAEVNPQLKVITFTDASCTGIYIEHVDD